MSGYIYSAENVNNSGDTINVPYAVTSREKVDVSDCKFIEDAYDEIIKAEENPSVRDNEEMEIPFEHLHIHNWREMTETLEKL